jgi:hypothetical protein
MHCGCSRSHLNIVFTRHRLLHCSRGVGTLFLEVNYANADLNLSLLVIRTIKKPTFASIHSDDVCHTRNQIFIVAKLFLS